MNISSSVRPDASPEIHDYLVMHLAKLGSLSRAVMKFLVVAFVKFPGLGWTTLNSSTKAEVAARPRGDVTRPGQPQIGDVFPYFTWVPHPVGDVAHDKST